MVGFTSASLFPSMTWEAVTQGEIREIDHETRRRTQGAGIIKAQRTSKILSAFQIRSRKARITRVRAPSPPTIEFTLPPPHILHLIGTLYYFLHFLVTPFFVSLRR